jgi:hypothetical protein
MRVLLVSRGEWNRYCAYTLRNCECRTNFVLLASPESIKKKIVKTRHLTRLPPLPRLDVTRSRSPALPPVPAAFQDV